MIKMEIVIHLTSNKIKSIIVWGEVTITYIIQNQKMDLVLLILSLQEQKEFKTLIQIILIKNVHLISNWEALL